MLIFKVMSEHQREGRLLKENRVNLGALETSQENLVKWKNCWVLRYFCLSICKTCPQRLDSYWQRPW